MSTAAVIAEFNPFHNGHKYIIEQARKVTGADKIVIIMSPDWVQSGKPAILPKEARTQMAIKCGADLVIELPVICATGSAEIFASGAIGILHDIGITDYLCFGCECTDVSLLERAAEILNNEPDEYKNILAFELKCGKSFPSAKASALRECLGLTDDSIVSSSNAILAIEYIRALKRRQSNIKPIAIKREGADYLNHTLTHDGSFASATAIRNGILTNGMMNLEDYMPAPAARILFSEAFFRPDYLIPIMTEKLFNMSEDELNSFSDADTELTKHIKHTLTNASAYNYDAFIQSLQPKNFTYGRVSRFICHVLNGIKADTLGNVKESNYSLYARILGFRSESAELLKEIKKNTCIPIISNMKDASEMFKRDYSDYLNTCLELDCRAGNLYRLLLRINRFTDFKYEEQCQIVIL